MSDEAKSGQGAGKPADVRTGQAAVEVLRDRGPKTVRRPPNKMLSGDGRRGYETK